MANLGLYIELKNGKLKKSNREILSLARHSKRDTYAILFSNDVNPYIDDLKGIKAVIQVTGEDIAYQPDIYAETLTSIIKEYNLVDFLGTYSAQGKDLFPRIAAKTNATLINDCIDVNLNDNTASKPIFAGKIMADYKLENNLRMYTLRPNVIAAEEPPKDGNPEIISKERLKPELKTKIIEVIKSAAQKIDLTEAEIIVSGGRAMKNKENFSILEELALVCNAGVGASRAAVDAEYATTDMQVGQTGKVVNPKVYIACGISGAIQHMAGMKTSKVIVAINKDSDAPIFKKADYGIVGDLFEVIPLLAEELKKAL